MFALQSLKYYLIAWQSFGDTHFLSIRRHLGCRGEQRPVCGEQKQQNSNTFIDSNTKDEPREKALRKNN